MFGWLSISCNVEPSPTHLFKLCPSKAHLNLELFHPQINIISQNSIRNLRTLSQNSIISNASQLIRSKACLLHPPSKSGLTPPKAVASTPQNPSPPAPSYPPSRLSSSSPPSRTSAVSAHTVSAPAILGPAPAVTRRPTAMRRAKPRPGRRFIHVNASPYGRASRTRAEGGSCRRRRGR